MKNILLTVIILFSFEIINAQVEEFTSDITERETIEIDYKFLGSSESQKIEVEIVDGYLIYDGDIIIGKEGAENDAGISGENFRWDEGIIPYVIQGGHPKKDDILEAISLINELTELNVQPRNGEVDYVEFAIGSGCSSWVGKIGGQQGIFIGNCPIGSIQHEILHAAGMYHEQSRSDRDEFVTIKEENINPNRKHNFRKVANTISVCPYDFGSIMHYPEKAFSINGKATIVPNKPLPAGVVMGQRSALSQCDIKGLANLYPKSCKNCECETSITFTKPINGFLDQEASNWIEGKTNNIIQVGANVTYDAGNQVLLKPGFKALNGSRFHAFIDGCGGNAKINAVSNGMEEVENDIGLTIYPNPFSEVANISYRFTNEAEVSIYLFDATGKRVATLTKNQTQVAGQHQLKLDASNLPTGMYYLKLQSKDNNIIKKLMIAK